MSLFEDLPEITPEEQTARTRLKELYKQIAHHNKQYHELDTQEISDAAYDALFKEALALEEKFPISSNRMRPLLRWEVRCIVSSKRSYTQRLCCPWKCLCRGHHEFLDPNKKDSEP